MWLVSVGRPWRIVGKTTGLSLAETIQVLKVWESETNITTIEDSSLIHSKPKRRPMSNLETTEALVAMRQELSNLSGLTNDLAKRVEALESLVEEDHEVLATDHREVEKLKQTSRVKIPPPVGI